MQERVLFFSKEDLSLSYYIRIAEKVVEEYSNGRIPKDINDHLEMFQIILFVENGVYSNKWDNSLLENIKNYSKVVAKFLQNLSIDALPSVYSSLIPAYTNVFWNAIDRYKIKKLINKEALKTLFSDNPYALQEILECERLVKDNSKVIGELLKENEHAAEWLLACYVEDDRFGNNRKKIHIPSSLSISDKDAIISEYIDRPDTNINYLRLIVFAKNSNDFKISDRTRLKAQRKEREQNQQILSDGNAIRTRYTVCMSEDDKAPIKEAKLENGNNLTLTYNRKFLLEQDPIGLLNYCAQVFEFTTRLGLISLISKKSEDGVVERIFSMSAQNAYPTSVAFNFNEAISWLQTEAMEDVLKQDGRSIEIMLKKLYETYFPDKFGYKGLEIEFAADDASWKQKCLVLLPLMENIAKQYTTYAENGEIDAELVSIMSPLKITDIPSTIKQKYYVIKGQPIDLWHLFHLFFSDQCMLTYVEPFKENHYHCFFDLVSKEIDLNYNNYKDYQKKDIDYLREQGYLSIDDNGIISVEKPKDILLLKQLYIFHACPYWYYDSITQGLILEMVEKGWLEEDNHLFTPNERDYFSYYLNNEKFTNGPALRNRYMHGSMIGASEAQHRKAYFRILNLFILLTLKIYEDLFEKQSLQNNHVNQGRVLSTGTMIHLHNIAFVITYDQLQVELKKSPDLTYISVPKEFWYGKGVAEYSNIDLVKDGYAIIPKEGYLIDYIMFYVNSGITRIALSQCEINEHTRLTMDRLRDLPLSVISEREQSACALLNIMLSISIEKCDNKPDKMDVMRRDLLIQIKEFICMEIMNPKVAHETGVILLNSITDLMADLLDIPDMNDRMLAFIDKIVFKDERSIMSAIKRARVAAQSASEGMNFNKK